MMIVEAVKRHAQYPSMYEENATPFRWLICNFNSNSSQPLIFSLNLEHFSLKPVRQGLARWALLFKITCGLMVLDYIPYSPPEQETTEPDLPWQHWMSDIIAPNFIRLGTFVKSPSINPKFKLRKDDSAITLPTTLFYKLRFENPECMVIPIPKDTPSQPGTFVCVQDQPIMNDTMKMGYLIANEVDMHTVLTKTSWRELFDLLQHNYKFVLVIAKYDLEEWQCLNLRKNMPEAFTYMERMNDQQPQSPMQRVKPMQIDGNVCSDKDTF